MPTGGFKILDTAEVKMAFSAYTMFLTTNSMHNISVADARAQAASNGNSGSNQSWFSSKSSSARCPALVQNEAKATDRTTFNQVFVTALQLVGPTQIVPATFMNAPPPRTASSQAMGESDNNNRDSNHKKGDDSSNSNNSSTPPKFDADLIAASRSHRIVREASVIAECSTVNPPARDVQLSSGAGSTSSPPPTARVRDCETLVLWNPACVTLALFNNLCTLFAFIDPASSDPVASSPHQKRIDDSERLVPLQTIKFSTRCTAMTTFTTHVDYLAAHGMCAVGTDTGPCPGLKGGMSNNSLSASVNNNNNNGAPPHVVPRGPFAPCELWSVFGFGSGDIAVWSHAQETMLKRHNNTSALTRDSEKLSKESGAASAGNNGGSPSSATARLCFVEPGIAVSAIARVERGHTERPTCMQWAAATADWTTSSDGNSANVSPVDLHLMLRTSASLSSASNSTLLAAAAAAGGGATPARFNTQTQPFCDVVVGYENGTILVVSLNATGGFVNHKLSGWFGFSAIRSLRPCPVAPSLIAVGCDNGSVRFMQFPWSFDVAYFEARYQQQEAAAGAAGSSSKNKNNNNNNDYDLTVADIGTARDPRVLCSIAGAVSGGAVTSVGWSSSGEAVVCTGEDDAVSMVSIQCTPSLQEFQEIQLSYSSSGSSSNMPALSPLKRQQNNHAQEPISVTPISIHRRNFNQSWLACNMVLSLDVVNYPGAAGDSSDESKKAAELRKVTGVYVASLDGGVVAGAAFPASELKGPRRTPVESGTAQQHMTAELQRHDSIASAVAAAAAAQRRQTNSAEGTAAVAPAVAATSEGLGIRNRPLARFLQMARNDTVVGLAPLGEYHAEGCRCCFGTTPLSNRVMRAPSSGADGSVAVVDHPPQRKRSFVSVTAKGAVALWTFYDILLEEEEEAATAAEKLL